MTSYHLLKIVLTVTKFLGIGPQSQKYHSIAILSVLTICVIVSSIDRPYLKSYTHIKFIITILCDIIAYFFNFYTTLFNKNSQKKLSEFFKIESTKLKIRHYLIFLILNLIFWVIILLSNYAFTQIVVFKTYLEIVIIDFEIYCQFLHGFTIFLILDLIKLKYRNLNKILLNYNKITRDEFFYLLKKIENCSFLLQDVVDQFNDIFGIPLLLLISYSTLHFVNYIDDLFFFRSDPKKFEAFLISNISLVSMIFVSI